MPKGPALWHSQLEEWNPSVPGECGCEKHTDPVEPSAELRVPIVFRMIVETEIWIQAWRCTMTELHERWWIAMSRRDAGWWSAGGRRSRLLADLVGSPRAAPGCRQGRRHPPRCGLVVRRREPVSASCRPGRLAPGCARMPTGTPTSTTMQAWWSAGGRGSRLLCAPPYFFASWSCAFTFSSISA